MYCFLGFIELNNIFNCGYSGCYAYGISYNGCKYCMMFNKHMPISLRSNSPSGNIFNAHKLRPNSENYGSSESSENDLNYISQINEVYIPFPFNSPNVSKILNTSNTTQLTNTTESKKALVNNINSYIDGLYLKYTLGGIILIIEKFSGYYNLL